ncbi:MAG: Ig-like domain-containing protein, partial [Lachnospiraceae bacterium]|nr:Ig-like domain-containing protein [Lachnospiraceae bacterium]
SVKPTYFLSSKPEVAEVDFETGKIKVLKKGSTTITIAYDNGIGAAKYKTKLVIK